MSSKHKYNLTFWQRLELPFIWLIWISMEKENRKSWHLVKKGMEHHTCTFGDVYVKHGYRFRDCTHEGCSVVSVKDDNDNWLDPLERNQ